MTKYICDKCGEWADEDKNVVIYEPHRCYGYMPDGSKIDGHRFTTLKIVGLCDDCLNKLIMWLDPDDVQRG